MSKADSLAIVAIPSAGDPVYNISSERVPHLTLLFLGDQSGNPNLTKIEEFVGHAANTSLTRFGMSVAKRGTLGDQEADVLFFDKAYASKVLNFRSHLLANRYIREAYDSVEQFPEWTPHLTLGYPSTPARKTDRDYLGWVEFDRIALWTGEYEGPTFELKLNESDGEVEMSAQLDDVLAHFGVKGMKWGVRRKRPRVDTRSEDDKDAAELSKKKTSELSNAELQRLATRRNLERQLAMSPETRKLVNDVVADILKEFGTRVVKTANSN